MNANSELAQQDNSRVMQLLEPMLAERSKHSTYQELHPRVEKLVHSKYLTSGKT